MSISNVTTRVSYAANGVLVAFATTFRFLEQEHLVVEVKPSGGVYATKTLGVDYTVAGEDVDAGGTVTFLTAPANLATVRITRLTPRTQETTFRNAGQSSFSPVLHERALDKLTMIDQEETDDITALQAGTTTVTATATRVTKTFVMGEPPEASPFPLTVACGVVPASLSVARVENLTTPGEVLREAVQAPQFTVSGTDAVLPYITGLTPGQQYRITFEVRT